MTEHTAHFENSVPPQLRAKLHSLALHVEDNIGEAGGEGFGCTHLNNISGVPLCGFIPHQRGGFEVSEFVRCDTDTSYHLSEAMTDSVNASEEYMQECMECDHGFNEVTTDWAEMTEEQKDIVQDYAADWFEPALVRFECWAENNEEVFTRLSVNHRDAPYYRPNRDETLAEKTYSQDEFLAATEEKLWEALTSYTYKK